MLKHASTNAGGPANGQFRSNNPAQRSIHLRPQQPLNVSTLVSSNSQSNSGTTNTNVLNGGQRIPTNTTLLNIASTPITTNNPPTTATAVTPTTPITSIVPNGIANNLHTYTNQHVALANTTNHSLYTNQSKSINPGNFTHNYSNCNVLNKSKHGPGPREALTSLSLLCLVSLILALLSLIFLLKISPNGRDGAHPRNPTDDFIIVYDVTLALCALSLSLNLCCLLVCAIQFLFAVKLARSPMFDGRDNKYLEKSSASRTCAVGGFFISIPIFLTGIILYTFNHFHSTPAIITSVLMGIGIVFCGGAMVHNVFIWQKEKTVSYRSPPNMNMSMISHIGPITPPPQFLSPQSHINYHYHPHCTSPNGPQFPLQPTSITPVSPNHSHGSFNPLATSMVNSSFLMRPLTATPPTPKPISNGCIAFNGREASGSVSPGMPPTLDMSNLTSTSLHELSTLV